MNESITSCAMESVNPALLNSSLAFPAGFFAYTQRGCCGGQAPNFFTSYPTGLQVSWHLGLPYGGLACGQLQKETNACRAAWTTPATSAVRGLDMHLHSMCSYKHSLTPPRRAYLFDLMA